jgi:hypothetical protein
VRRGGGGRRRVGLLLAVVVAPHDRVRVWGGRISATGRRRGQGGGVRLARWRVVAQRGSGGVVSTVGGRRAVGRARGGGVRGGTTGSRRHPPTLI